MEYYVSFVGTVWRIKEDGTYLVQDTCYNNPPDEERHYEAMTDADLRTSTGSSSVTAKR